jgi:hypothetical protein
MMLLFCRKFHDIYGGVANKTLAVANDVYAVCRCLLCCCWSSSVWCDTGVLCIILILLFVAVKNYSCISEI